MSCLLQTLQRLCGIYLPALGRVPFPQAWMSPAKKLDPSLWIRLCLQLWTWLVSNVLGCSRPEVSPLPRRRKLHMPIYLQSLLQQIYIFWNTIYCQRNAYKVVCLPARRIARPSCSFEKWPLGNAPSMPCACIDPMEVLILRRRWVQSPVIRGPSSSSWGSSLSLLRNTWL